MPNLKISPAHSTLARAANHELAQHSQLKSPQCVEPSMDLLGVIERVRSADFSDRVIQIRTSTSEKCDVRLDGSKKSAARAQDALGSMG